MKILKKIMIRIVIVGVIGVIIYGSINLAVIGYAKKYMIELDEVVDVDATMVLGALVYNNGSLSVMLRDRMDYGIESYENGLSKALLLSGDHGQNNYDEVNNMKQYAQEKGVPTEVIFMDHAGFSTYESMYRARDVFKVESLVIVTQGYHLNRAVYIARKMGIDAYGIASDPHSYPKINYYKLRESMAVVKDFLYVNIFKPKPKYLGEAIPIDGDATLTHDK